MADHQLAYITICSIISLSRRCRCRCLQAYFSYSNAFVHAPFSSHHYQDQMEMPLLYKICYIYTTLLMIRHSFHNLSSISLMKEINLAQKNYDIQKNRPPFNKVLEPSLQLSTVLRSSCCTFFSLGYLYVSYISSELPFDFVGVTFDLLLYSPHHTSFVSFLSTPTLPLSEISVPLICSNTNRIISSKWLSSSEVCSHQLAFLGVIANLQ
jgi:hypothetical protein